MCPVSLTSLPTADWPGSEHLTRDFAGGEGVLNRLNDGGAWAGRA